jgi:hypothetical protein
MPSLPALQPDYRDRLVKLLGKLGSDNDAERAVAARLADEHRRKSGLTWHDIILPLAEDRPHKPRKAKSRKPKVQTWLEKAQTVAGSSVATDWERAFASKLTTWRGVPSEKQLTCLERVWRKCNTKNAESQAA